jgi:hypothetical protein
MNNLKNNQLPKQHSHKRMHDDFSDLNKDFWATNSNGLSQMTYPTKWLAQNWFLFKFDSSFKQKWKQSPQMVAVPLNVEWSPVKSQESKRHSSGQVLMNIYTSSTAGCLEGGKCSKRLKKTC